MVPIRITVVVGVAILVVAVVGLSRHQPSSNQPPGLTTQEAYAEASARVAEQDGQVRDQARQAVAAGDLSKTDQIYQTAINSETTTIRKIQLLIDESGVLYESGKYTDAVQTAKKAETLSDDKYLVADWLSRLYEDRHEYSLAAEYYRLASKWANSPMNKTGLTKSYYDDKAALMASKEKG